MCRDAWRWQSMNPEGYVTGAAAPGQRFHASPEAVLSETHVEVTPQTRADEQEQRGTPRARKKRQGGVAPNSERHPAPATGARPRARCPAFAPSGDETIEIRTSGEMGT